MEKIQKVVIGQGRRFYVKDKDLHTEYGYIKYKQMKPGVVRTNTGKEFKVFDAQFVDRFKRLKRGAQIITLKDAGVIITECGLGKESKVVEAGGGSGQRYEGRSQGLRRGDRAVDHPRTSPEAVRITRDPHENGEEGNPRYRRLENPCP